MAGYGDMYSLGHPYHAAGGGGCGAGGAGCAAGVGWAPVVVVVVIVEEPPRRMTGVATAAAPADAIWRRESNNIFITWTCKYKTR